MFKKINLLNSLITETYIPENNKYDKHIAVLMGGISTEREVSMSSAKAVVTHLKMLNHKVTAIDMGRDISSVLQQIKPDIVFNCLHGSYGENGAIPGLLEILGIPYTHSGILASSIGLDKIKSKFIFKAHGIKCPEDVIIKKSDNIQHDPMPRPYVIKPINEGSSVGIHVIFEGDNFDIRDYKFDYGNEVIVEKYIAGKEIQVAIVNNKAIGALEIVPKGRFYDYAAKYIEEMAATHIMPAELSDAAIKKVLAIAEIAHNAIGCKSTSRVEFRYDPNEGVIGEFYLLEVNTHPGMTPLSIVPEIAAYYGINFLQFIQSLIDDAGLENEAI
jgi:D-alanine-D-alanine ligase